MAFFTKSDLKYKNSYDWKAAKEHDNPYLTHFPDNKELARHEGYEVLHFINKLAEVHELKSKASSHKIEDMLKSLPGSIRSSAKIHQWIMDNWSKY